MPDINPVVIIISQLRVGCVSSSDGEAAVQSDFQLNGR